MITGKTVNKITLCIGSNENQPNMLYNVAVFNSIDTGVEADNPCAGLWSVSSRSLLSHLKAGPVAIQKVQQPHL